MAARVCPFDCTRGSLRNSYRAVSLRICPRRACKYVLVHPRCAPQLHRKTRDLGLECPDYYEGLERVTKVFDTGSTRASSGWSVYLEVHE